MKRIIEEFIPSIFSKFLGKKATKNSHQIFPSYQDALKLCTTSAYEEEELIEVIFKKN